MWAPRYFANRFWNPRYWDDGSAALTGGGNVGLTTRVGLISYSHLKMRGKR